MRGTKNYDWDAVAREYRAGATLDELAGRHPFSTNTIRKYLLQRGVSTRGRGRRVLEAQDGTLKCRDCGRIKPLAEFAKHSNSASGVQREKWCKVCRAAYSRATAPTGTMRLLGLTRADYDQMAEAQGGKCAICGEAPKGRHRLAVDHCHSTGMVRKLLCQPCNVALGVVERKPGFLDGARRYLAEHAKG